MKKWKKYSLLSIGSLLVLCLVVLGILYACRPNLVKGLLGIDTLKGQPYTNSGYDGIDVSKHNGFIKWKEVAKTPHVKYVFIKATEGKGYVDPRYRKNIRQARKAGLKVGSYHFLTSKYSATAQFQYFKSVVRKSEQDLIPVLDVENQKVSWRGKQLQDSVRVFAELVKKHYGKYPIIYSGQSFYNKILGHAFNKYLLFIANYNNCQPYVGGKGKCNIWQYSECGHLHGIGYHVDLSRLMNGTTVKDLMLQ